MDYVSETAEVWLTFHSDFSVSGDGFHAVWSTMHLTGCPQQNIEDSHEGELFSPYYPNYYLPNLNCTYHLMAPGRNLMVPISIHFSAAHIDYAIFSCGLLL